LREGVEKREKGKRMMYIKNRRGRNYDGLLKTGLCKLWGFREL
jgi:hypothetical protein